MRILFTLAVLMVAAGAAAADTQWSQVSWFTGVSVAHHIEYGVYNSSLACSQNALYYVEPTPIDGSEQKINASTDSTGNYKCQDASKGAIKVVNDGSVGLNVTAAFNQVTSGVAMKVATANAGYESACSGTCTAGGCDLSAKCLAVATSNVQIAYNLPQNASKEYWMWADFAGVAGTAQPTKGNLTTTGVQYAH
jgi:hypothetical protein